MFPICCWKTGHPIIPPSRYETTFLHHYTITIYPDIKPYRNLPPIKKCNKTSTTADKDHHIIHIYDHQSTSSIEGSPTSSSTLPPLFASISKVVTSSVAHERPLAINL